MDGLLTYGDFISWQLLYKSQSYYINYWPYNNNGINSVIYSWQIRYSLG